MFILIGALAAAALPQSTSSGWVRAAIEAGGRFECTGRFVRSGRPMAASIEIRRGNDPETFVVTHDDRAPGTYHATELWWLGPDGGRAAIADASGMRSFDVTTGENILALARSDQAGPIERFTYRLAGGGLGVEWWHRDSGGVMSLGDTLSCSAAIHRPAVP